MQTETQTCIDAVIGNPIFLEPSGGIYSRDLTTKTKTGEELTRGLLELFKEDARELPTCKPYVRAFISTRLPNVGMAAELPCGSWECKKCGPRLKLKWYYRHVIYMSTASNVEKIYINKEDWSAMHRNINRQGEKYLKYEQHDGSLLLITTARLGGEEIPIDKREYELVRALMNTAFTRQPVSQSRNWINSPVNNSSEGSGDGDGTGSNEAEVEANDSETEHQTNWMPLDTLKFTELDAVLNELAEMGIAASPHSIYSRTHGSIRAVTFVIPKDSYWQTLWRLGACARQQPSNGPNESRETQWVYDDDDDPIL